MSPEGTTIPDAVLVAGVLAGDRDSFAAIYDRYADRLHDVAFSILRHREEAADAVADSFVTMAEKLDQLREPDLLRPWLYSVVRRECFRRISARDRQAFEPEERLAAMTEPSLGPAERAEQGSLRQLLEDAAEGLNDRDREVLDLHLRHGLDGADLAEVIGTTAPRVHTLMNRLRGQVEGSLGALLVARRGRSDCPDLAGLLDDWDGRFTPLVRKRVARHVRECPVCETRRSAMLAPAALLSVAPIVAAPVALRDRVLDDTRLVSFWSSAAASPGSPGTPGPPGGPGGAGGGGLPPQPEPERRRRGGPVVLGAVAVVVALGVILALVAPDRTLDVSLAEGQAPLLTGPPPAAVGAFPGTAAPDLAVAPTEEPQPTRKPRRSPTPTSGTTDTPGDDSPEAPSASPTPAPAPTATPRPTPTPQPGPGRLAVSSRLVVLDAGRGQQQVTLSNTGERPIDVQSTPRSSWMAASPRSARLAPGELQVVVIEVDRTSMAEGTTEGVLDVSGGEATIPVQVRVITLRPPRVAAPSFTTTGPCTGGRSVNVTTTVADESDIAGVRLLWSGAGSGQVPMSPTPGGWTARIGTFDPLTRVAVEVRATDVAGAVGEVTSSYVVEPCPG